MKVLIQGLGEVPATIELALEEEKPDVTYILCSDYQLNYVAHSANYIKPNRQVVTEAARKVGAKLVLKKCDVFDPESISDAIHSIMKKIDPSKDEVVVNYSGGSAPVRLFLGVLGIHLTTFAPKTRVLYAISYPKGIKIATNQTEKLQRLLPNDISLLFSLAGKRKGTKSRQRR